MSELVFFVGKGGVGKTTISSAYAITRALKKPSNPVLLVSSDPAHSLGDVLQMDLGDSPAKVPLSGRSKLHAWEMNSAELFRSFLAEHKEELLDAVEKGSLFTREEVSALLDSALPGMAEIAALLAIHDAVQSGKYSTIVIDTAPFGHTLRLFTLPDQFARLLNFLELSADRDRVLAQHFGGRAAKVGKSFVDTWRDQIDELQVAFAGSSLFLVTTAEDFALNESVRCMEALRKSNPETKLTGIVLNRAVLRPKSCARCIFKAKATRRAKAMLSAKFRGAELHLAEDPGHPILGTRGLKAFGASTFLSKPLKWKPTAPPARREPGFRLSPAAWPTLNAPLNFVLGKGGVGKTTVSAALGYNSRQHDRSPVEICSVDPAPSLDDIFQTPVGDRPRAVLGDKEFRASELDALALFRDWIAEIRSEIDRATSGSYSGVHVDLSYDRKLFSELLEIVPPGLDEVLAIFRIVELLGGDARKVIIDMAPTGHALELLRMPARILVWSRLLLKSLSAHRKLALAREAAVKIAELEVPARSLSIALHSPREATVFSVMLPETLPDRETERLLNELGALDLSAKILFVNRVLLPDEVAGCARCQSAVQWQAVVLGSMKRRFRGKTIYAIRDFEHEIVGKQGLRELTGELWLLN